MQIKHQKNKKRICNLLGINPFKNIFTFKNKHMLVLKYELNLKEKVRERNLKFSSFYNLIKTYKHIRNTQGYPSRGQRTRTNAITKNKNKLKISS